MVNNDYLYYIGEQLKKNTEVLERIAVCLELVLTEFGGHTAITTIAADEYRRVEKQEMGYGVDDD